MDKIVLAHDTGHAPQRSFARGQGIPAEPSGLSCSRQVDDVRSQGRGLATNCAGRFIACTELAPLITRWHQQNATHAADSWIEGLLEA